MNRHPYIYYRGRAQVYVLFLLLCLWLPSQRLQAQAVEAEFGIGEVLKMDQYLKQMLLTMPARTYSLGYVYQTTAKDKSGFASDYNFPSFTFGLTVADFTGVTLKSPYHSVPVDYISRMGVSYVLQASFRRPFFRHRSGWGADYTLSNGIGFSTRPYNRQTNIDNEMIGSLASVYFGLSFDVTYRYRQCEFFLGPEFRHLSNGAMARPNKGANKAGIGVGMRYYIEPVDSMNFTRTHHQPFDKKGFYMNFTYRAGFKTAIGEWLRDLGGGADMSKLVYGGQYPMYVSHGMSVDFMYRYARRWASGIGVDAYYEPKIRQVETQNSKEGVSVDGKYYAPANMNKWSWGIAAKHEVFFQRMSVQVAIGYYLSRPFAKYAHTDEEYGYYERVGIRYNLPILNDCLSVGYNIHAHRTKAYQTELVLDVHLPFK